MSLDVPRDLEEKIEELISRYPRKRSASVMILHALQAHYGFISPEAMEWTAGRLELEPINILELVTFYPMFRSGPVGIVHLKLCRTLSCALSGSHELHRHLCEKLGLDSAAHGPQTSADGGFTVEFVECLASCGTAPVMMCDDDLHEEVTPERAEEILARCGR